MGTIKSTVIKRELRDFIDFVEQIKNSSEVPFNESATEQEARIKQGLNDYDYFAQTYFAILCPAPCAPFHIKFANEVKSRLANEQNLTGLAEWPREHAKSVHLDIIIPAWLLANELLEGMILMGKNETDACNLLSDIQAQLMGNQLFIHDFGDQYNLGSWEDGDFTTKKGIRFLAIGRDQSPRGTRKGAKRPNYAVIDDIDDDDIVNNLARVKRVVNKIFGALWFALRTESAALVMAGNRIHPQGILAHFAGDVKPGSPKREELFHSKIFAIDPKTGLPAWKERYTLEVLESKMKAAGQVMSRREYFHENSIEGSIFKDQYINWKPMPPSSWHKYKVIEGYFDPSFENNPTSDYKAVRVWGVYGWEFHLLKSFVRRTELSEVFEWMSAQDDQCKPGVAIIWRVEKQFFNRPIQDAIKAHNRMRRRNGKPELVIITDNRTKENKYTRIVRMEPEYVAGNIYHNVLEEHNNDMIEGNNQLKGIEPGYKTADDSPDADEGAWHYLRPHRPDNNWTPQAGRNSYRNRW